jgi:hypothetical protein
MIAELRFRSNSLACLSQARYLRDISVSTKLKTALVVTLAGLVAAAGVLSGSKTRKPAPVSLVFQRYSDLDPYVGDVAFLWLTNASSNSYLLTMTGSTNTVVLDTLFGRFRQSWMVNCQFSDETSTGWTNWIQMPSPVRGSNAYLSLGPRSGFVIRVPLPEDGQRRKVAVLYEGPYTTAALALGAGPGISIRVPTTNAPNTTAGSFWLTPTGFRLFRLLPRPLRERVFPSASLHKAWCDRELSYPPEKAR